MFANRVRLKLGLAFFLSLSSFWVGAGAIAQSALLERASAEDSTHMSNHTEASSEQPPEPLGEFREEALSTAVSIARTIEDPKVKVAALIQLSQTYFRRGQTDAAKAIALEAISTAERLEDADERLDLWVNSMLRYNVSLLESINLRESILSKAISALLASSTPPERQVNLSPIVEELVRTGDYEQARSLVDLVENDEVREMIIYTAFTFYTASPEDSDTVATLFPELEQARTAAASIAAESADYSNPLFRLMAEMDESFLTLSSSPQPDELNAFVSEQTAAIEVLSEPYYRAYGYAALGLYIREFEGRDRVIALLDLATSQSEDFSTLSAPEALESVFGASAAIISLQNFVALGFTEVGEAERGLEILRASYLPIDALSNDDAYHQLSELTHLIEYFFYKNFISSEAPEDSNEVKNLLPVLINDAEQMARSLYDPTNYDPTDYDPTNYDPTNYDPVNSLINIGILYTEIEDTENAQRLAQELLVAARSGAIALDKIDATRLTLLFSRANLPNLVLELATSIENPNVLTEMTAQLVGQGYVDSARSLVDSTTSPAARLQMLIRMAHLSYAFTEGERFDLATRALEIALSSALTEDEYFSALPDYYVSAERGENLLNGILVEIVSIADSATNKQQLIDRVEDTALRESLIVEFFPSDAAAEDKRLADVAKSAASDRDFQAALSAIADITSPYSQVTVIKHIVNCHTNSETVLTDEARSILQRIRPAQ